MAFKHLFSSPFRAWFFSGSVSASLVIWPWLAQLSGLPTMTPLHGLFWWHQHEMIFAIAVPFILGFLLTASQNWTGESPIQPVQLVITVLIWWLARLSIALNLPLAVCVVLEVTPLLASTLLLAKLLIKHRNYRNLIMVALLIMLSIADIAEMTAPQQVTQWARFSVLVVILLIIIFGGRVIPFFTASGLGVNKALPILWLERALMITQALATLLLPFAPEAAVVRGLALVIAVLHVLRWIRWQHWALWQKPLLWSLHLAYFNIALGWLAIGLLGLNSVTLHALAIGGIGLMILAFAGRVSLAHSGRALKPSPIFAITLLFVTAAVIFRVWIPLLFNVDSVSLRYIASGIFWATGYAVFTAIYFRIWFSPRSVGH